MFYELIFETGNSSIAEYADDNEALTAIREHHTRATKGEHAQASNPGMGPAERIARVLKYNVHPVELNESQAMNVEELTALVVEAVKEKAVGDLVSVPEVASAVRDLTNPVVVDSAPHDSNYKMAEVAELDKTEWS